MMFYIVIFVLVLIISIVYILKQKRKQKKLDTKESNTMSDYGFIVNDVNLITDSTISLIEKITLEDGKSYSRNLPTGAYATVIESLTIESLRKFSGLDRSDTWSFHEIVIENNTLKINWVNKNRNSPLKPIIVNIWR